MHELYDDLEDMCETLAKELSKTNEKLEKAGGQISSGDVDYIDKLTHAIKSIKTTKAMMESEDDYSGAGYDMRMGRSYARGGHGDYNRMSYARGRGRNARRDSMGRYSSDNNEMVMELRELMEDAPDEKTRMEFDRFIKKMEQM